MTAFSGVLFDGHTAARRDVDVELDDATLTIVADGTRTTFARTAVRVDAPVAGVPRRLMLPDGAVVETVAEDAVTAAWPRQRSLDRAAFWLESRNWVAVAAIVLTAALVAFVIVVVLPLAADPVARRISPQIARVMSDRALQTMDRAWLRHTQLPTARTDTIVQEFEALAKGAGVPARLEFRAMGEPNAFALPDGTIVVADEMVAFTRNDDELMAVLAHELGHVRHQHSLRMLLRQSGVAVLVTALAGDAAGMTMLAVILPAALLDGHYSREFELEADADALAFLEASGRSPQLFADMLRRFAADPRSAGPRDPLSRYLSSHPELEERIRRVEAAR